MRWLLLIEQCGALNDEGARISCVVGGAEALLLVAALEGNPREDIDWTDASGSFASLLGTFKEAARRRCAMAHEAIERECVVKEQAAMLGFPATVGSGCANKAGRFEKESCLGALQIIAVYLQAMRRVLDPSKPL
jgi:hypothetical protein